MKNGFQSPAFRRLTLAIFFLLASWSSTLMSQGSQLGHGGHDMEVHSHQACISNDQRKVVLADVEANVAQLKKQGKLPENEKAVVSFGWPLRLKSGLTDPSYYTINNFVDENFGSGVQDYNCGTRTYNGHPGTDIDIWPFPWTKMANNEVEVIAAAAGTIVAKYDGYFDQNCSTGNTNWNGFIIQHSDGTRSWYVHMKKNSLISKGVGQTVSQGEYLGIVGSSGSSTAPHLHFEVSNSNNQVVDPWGGNCNYLGGQSLWASQKPYDDPRILKIMTHNAEPQMPQCPSETVNASNNFQPSQLIYFASYFRDRKSGQIATYTVKRPNGTVWKTWTQNPTSSYSKYWWYWWYTLPADAPSGTWTYTVALNNQTVTHNFTVASATCTAPTTSQLSANNITSNTAKINCSVTGVQSYKAKYRVSGSGESGWVLLNSTTNNFYNLSNLFPTTQYDFQYQVRCSNGVWSAWSSTKTFMTNIPQTCTPPSSSQLFTSNPGSNTYTINCSLTGVLSYDWQYRVAGSNNDWINVPSSSNPYYNLTGLFVTTFYEWRCSVKCQNGVWSAWSNIQSFITNIPQTGGLANDDPCGATLLPLNGGCINTTNLGATLTNPPTVIVNGDCPTTGMVDVWYKIYMPSTAVAYFWLNAGTLTDAVVATYTGSCNNLVQFGCYDDTNGNLMPNLQVISTPNTYVWIRVWGFNGSQGTFSICGQAGFQGDGGGTDSFIPPTGIASSSRSSSKGDDEVEYNSTADNLMIFPNPVKDNLTLAFHLEAAEEATFEVLNMEGRVMETGIIEGDDRSNVTRQLDVSALPGGIYFLRLKIGKQLLTERFVKQ